MVLSEYELNIIEREADKQDLDIVIRDHKCFIYSNETDELILSTSDINDVLEYLNIKYLYYDDDNIKQMIVPSSLDIVQEEMAELIQAISKYKRKYDSASDSDKTSIIAHIYEEMADVSISIRLLDLMLKDKIPGITLDDYLETKMHRNMQRVEKGEFK